MYTTSETAIHVYTKCGFEIVTPEPIADEKEGGKLYLVMAKRVSIGAG